MTPHEEIRRIHAAALAAADAGAAVRRALRLEGGALWLSGAPEAPEARVALAGERVWVVGAGKAAAAMAAGAVGVLGPLLAGGAVTVPHGTRAVLPGVEVWEAAHPVPDAHGLAGAAEARRLAGAAGAGELLLVLLSGGASALWAAPPAGVSLGELQRLTTALLRAGVPIAEVNTVRKHLSRLGGGQLALAAAPARVLALAISDVVGSPPETIASGPTTADPSTYADALAVLSRHGVAAPPAVLAHLQRGAAGALPETPKPGDPRLAGARLRLVASVRDALRGAAEEAARLGYTPRVVSEEMQGEAREVAADVVATARQARQGARLPLALLWGGETTVTVRGSGRGGRNQELALAAALRLEGEAGITLAALATDGRDGVGDAAGAVVDGQSAARARARGLQPEACLQDNDSYAFFRATGEQVVTGPSGTNVSDLVVVLVAPPPG